jgi:hypothetical protein
MCWELSEEEKQEVRLKSRGGRGVRRPPWSVASMLNILR